MKIRNSKGKSVKVPKEHEQAVRDLIAKGDHDTLTSMANGGWISKAVNPAHKGFCTPMTKATCTPKRKAFAKTMKKHHGFHQDGGAVDGDQSQQLVQAVAQALQQGAKPEVVLQSLIKKGIPQDQATQLIQGVLQQLQGQQQPQQQACSGIRMRQMGGQPPMQDPSQGQVDPGQQGGGQEQQMQQLLQVVMQALQQGKQPQEIMQMLVQQGVPQEVAQQVIQAAMQQGQQGAQQEQPQMAQLGAAINPQNPYNYRNTYNPALGYYGNISAYEGAQARDYRKEAKTDLAQSQQLANNPYVAAPGAADELQKQGQGELKMARAGEFTSVVAGLNQGVHSITDQVLSPLSAGFANLHAKLEDEASQNYAMRNNRAIIKPFQGGEGPVQDPRVGSQQAYKKYGGKLKRYQIGGAPTEGSDFQSQDPNVMTERGETISDPTKGPVGPDGNPTGAVVHDTTGDQHSDPSGGNAYKLGQDSVVHSKVLGVKIGDFVKFAQEFPDAEKIIATVTAKYKNPDKEVSFAKISALFDTKKLLAEVEKIEKLAEKNEKHGGPDATKPSQETAKLNRKTLGKKLNDTKEQIQTNSQIAGAEGPIHAMSEGLKHSGAYGPKIQQEAQQQMENPEAKHGIVMKGKKLRLPMAQTGHLVYGKRKADAMGRSAAINTAISQDPTADTQTTTSDEHNNYIKVGNDWHYNNPGQGVGAVVPDQTIFGTMPIKIAKKTDDQFYNSGTPTVQQSPIQQPAIAQPGTQGLPDPSWSDYAGKMTQFGQDSPFVYPATPSPFNVPWGGPYKTKSDLPGKYASPEALAEVMRNTGDKFSNVQPDPGYDPTSVGALQHVQVQNSPYEVLDSYKNGYNRYNNAHLTLLKNNADYKAHYKADPGHQPTDADFAFLTDAEILQGHQDKTWGKDAIKYATVKFNKGEEQAYKNWLDNGHGQGMRRVGNSYIDKDYVQGPDDQPIYYTPDTSDLDFSEPPAPKKAIDISGITTGNISTPTKPRSVYQEGYLGQGELLPLIFPNKPVPFINSAAGDEAAINQQTRKRFVNPYIGDLQRSLVGKTWNNSNDPVSKARAANDKSNAWEESQRRFSDADTKNAEIEQRYNDANIRLTQEAGLHHAQSLDTAVQRVAKRDSASEDRIANAVSSYLSHSKENTRDQRASVIEQQMFANEGWNPYRGLYDVAGGKDVLSPGFGRSGADAATLKDQYIIAQINHLNASGQKDKADALKAELSFMKGKAEFGGKVGRATSKIMRKKK